MRLKAFVLRMAALVCVVASPALAQPVVTAVLNAFSLDQQLSSQVSASIFGSNLASQNCAASQAPLPLDLCGVEVAVNGQPTHLLFVGPGQINVHFPAGLAVGPGTVTVTHNAVASNVFAIVIQSHAPGISSSQPPLGDFFRSRGNFSVATQSNPAEPGEIVISFLTGLGETNPAVGSGQLPPNSPLAVTVLTPTVLVDGDASAVFFSGLTPSSVGWYQVNFALSPLLRPGLYDVTVMIGGHSSNTVKIAVGARKARIGVYRSGSWFLDDGNNVWDGCGTDSCAGFGAPGDVMVVGDFNGDGIDEIGFRRLSSFFLDNGNRTWNGCFGGELCMGLGFPTDTPLAGDWDGDGTDQVGVYRDGSWFLDNGNYQWDGCGTEICAGFGVLGDLPVTGDFDGDHVTQIGLYRNGSWFLDNGNFQWDGCQTETCYGLGQAGDTPIVGDFNGDGMDQVGVFRAGSWFIDDGDFVWEGCGIDTCAGFGAATAQPVPGDYDGDGIRQIAIYDNGFWAIDNGNFQWDGCGVDTCVGLGQPGDLPAPGRW